MCLGSPRAFARAEKDREHVRKIESHMRKIESHVRKIESHVRKIERAMSKRRELERSDNEDSGRQFEYHNYCIFGELS
jgi:hypothetical protein